MCSARDRGSRRRAVIRPAPRIRARPLDRRRLFFFLGWSAGPDSSAARPARTIRFRSAAMRVLQLLDRLCRLLVWLASARCVERLLRERVVRRPPEPPSALDRARLCEDLELDPPRAGEDRFPPFVPADFFAPPLLRDDFAEPRPLFREELDELRALLCDLAVAERPRLCEADRPVLREEVRRADDELERDRPPLPRAFAPSASARSWLAPLRIASRSAYSRLLS